MGDLIGMEGGLGMAKATPEEMAEARRKKAEERRLEEEEQERRREKEEAARQERMRKGVERQQFLISNWQRVKQLRSVLDGYYTEMDKLAKKAPADEVTELALKRINDVITRGKELMIGDEFIDSLEVFVAAGERPEHRDVLLVLAELIQGLSRLNEEFEDLNRQARNERWGEYDWDLVA